MLRAVQSLPATFSIWFLENVHFALLAVWVCFFFLSFLISFQRLVESEPCLLGLFFFLPFEDAVQMPVFFY